MDLRMQGTVVLITGGGRGIGRASALAFGAEDVSVIVADIDLAVAESVAQEVVAKGGRATAVFMDVASESSVEEGIAAGVAVFGRLDHLVLCAGVSGLLGQPFDEIEASAWDDVFAVNVKGQWLPVKYGAKYLRASDQGSVAIIASDSSIVASPLHVPYCTSKGALLMLVRALAVDLRRDNIRVNCVCPSVVNTRMPKIDTGMAENDSFDGSFPVHEASDIANYLVWLSSPVTHTISGHALVADFGFSGESSFPM